MRLRELLDRIPFQERSAVRMFRSLAAGASVAVIDAETGTPSTYSDLARRADAISAALVRFGVRPGDRVAWSMPTGIDAIATWMGIAQIGAVDVGIGDVLKGKLLDHVLDDCKPAALVIDISMTAGLAGLSGERRAAFSGVVLVRAAGVPTATNEVHLSLAVEPPVPPGSLPIVEVDCRGPGTIIYTSGTTGPSKGVVLCHHHQFFVGANLVEHFRIHEGARLYHYSPFNHVTGRQLVIAAMITGSTLVMRERFSLDAFWNDINRHGITHSITLGSAVPLLLSSRDPSARNDGSLRYVWASPAMSQIYAEFARRFALRVVSPYGSTEVGIVVEPCVIPDEPGPPGNSGRRPEYFDLEILDENDQICPPGVVGEIGIRPRLPWTTFIGYLGRDGSTLDTVRNYWYHSGDLARMDERGYLFFVDRKQDFMRVKGENVSSIELEQILLGHPLVVDCAVVPVKSDVADNEILAVLMAGTAAGAFDPADFFRWCAQEVPHYMVPRFIRLVQDMPRGHSGKVEKHKLRAQGVTDTTWDAATNGLRATRKGVVKTEAPPV